MIFSFALKARKTSRQLLETDLGFLAKISLSAVAVHPATTCRKAPDASLRPLVDPVSGFFLLGITPLRLIHRPLPTQTLPTDESVPSGVTGGS